MNKNYAKYVNKIAYVENKHLSALASVNGGHYVIIRNVDMNKKRCDVNVITSLENNQKVLNTARINKVKRGYLYPIPYYDSTFVRWSAINLDTIKGIPLTKIKLVNDKKIKRRHFFFYRKFSK